MKKHIVLFAILLVAICSSTVVKAQGLERNDIMYNMYSLPQSNQLNPAFFQKYRSAYISLIGINTSMGMPIAYKDIQFTYDQENDKYRINLYDLSSKLDNDKSIHFGLNVDIFGFGFRTDKFFITFNSSAVADVAFYFPSGLASILHDGFADRIGVENAAEISTSQMLHVTAYERYSLGFGYYVNQNLTVGAHFNLLNGIMNMNIEDTRIGLYATDDAYSTIHADLNYRMVRGGCLDFSLASKKDNSNNNNGGNGNNNNDEGSEVKFNHTFNNTGFTFDLGASYKLGDFTFSGSIIDLGPGIHWVDNVKAVEPKRKSVDFNGGNFGGLVDNGQVNNEFGNSLVDSLSEMFMTKDVESTEYWYSVPTKIFLGAGYDFNRFLRANLLFHGEWDRGLITAGKGFDLGNGHFRCNTSLSATFNVAGWVELSVANAFAFDGEDGSLFNPGVGITLSPANTIQFFLMADYISSFYAVEEKATNIHFGFNVRFGKNRDKHSNSDDDSAAMIQIEQAPASNSADPTNANAANEPIVF